MNSSGDITRCVVPSRQVGLELEYHLAGRGLQDGRVLAAAQLL